MSDDMLDLDALSAEANGAEPFRFRFGGEEYELPPTVDVRVAALFSDGQLFAGLAKMLGEDQWQRMQDAEAVLDDRQLMALMEEYGKHSGSSLGESKASTDSSMSTVRPSKRTSGGSTKSGYRK